MNDNREIKDHARAPAGCLETEPLLAEYAEGGLVAFERRSVERHLEDCSFCRGLVEDMAPALALCREAAEKDDVEPPARMVARILEQTTGKLSWPQRLRLWVRPVLEPRLAMGLAMALLSFSLILKAFDVDFQQVTMADLAPSQVFRQLDRKVHLAGTRAVKYYRDLRIVYEIQTQLQAIREDAVPAPAPGPQQRPLPTAPPQDQPQPPAHNRFSRHPVYVALAVF